MISFENRKDYSKTIMSDVELKEFEMDRDIFADWLFTNNLILDRITFENGERFKNSNNMLHYQDIQIEVEMINNNYLVVKIKTKLLNIDVELKEFKKINLDKLIEIIETTIRRNKNEKMYK